MTSKNGSHDHDLTPDAIDSALKLYDRIRQAAARSRKTETVEVPEWGMTLTVGTLSADDMDWVEGWYRDLQQAEKERAELEGREPGPLVGVRAMAVALSVIDPETGEKVFTPADADWLGKESGAVIDRLFDAADRLSGITPRGKGDIRKNSPETAGAEGSSPSASDSA